MAGLGVRRLELGNDRQWAAAAPAREQMAGIVVNGGLLDVRIGANGVDVFLCRLTVIEAQCRRNRRGQRLCLDFGLVKPLRDIRAIDVQRHADAGDQERNHRYQCDDRDQSPEPWHPGSPLIGQTSEPRPPG